MSSLCTPPLACRRAAGRCASADVWPWSRRACRGLRRRQPPEAYRESDSKEDGHTARTKERHRRRNLIHKDSIDSGLAQQQVHRTQKSPQCRTNDVKLAKEMSRHPGASNMHDERAVARLLKQRDRSWCAVMMDTVWPRFWSDNAASTTNALSTLRLFQGPDARMPCVLLDSVTIQ